MPLRNKCATRWASVLVLPDPAPGDDQERTGAQELRVPVFDRAALLGIEPVEIASGHGGGGHQAAFMGKAGAGTGRCRPAAENLV